MEKKKIRFIINPKSGVSKKEYLADQITQHIDHQFYDLDIQWTTHVGHAKTLSLEAVKKGYDTVVAVGGDGSVNEVASQLRHTGINLGIISAGSGNGFAGNLGLERNNVVDALEVINKRNIQLIDSCEANGNFYINVAGFGFDGKISYNSKKGTKRGIIMYVREVLKESFNKKFFKADILIDGKAYHGEFITIVVANAAMYGYNFVVAPDADLQDGLLDIVMIKKTSIYKYFLNSYRFLNRSISQSSFVDIYRGKEVSIKSYDDQIYYHVDGEGMKGPQEIKFSILPKSIYILRH